MSYARQVRSAHHPQGGRGGCFRWGQPETVPKAGLTRSPDRVTLGLYPIVVAMALTKKNLMPSPQEEECEDGGSYKPKRKKKPTADSIWAKGFTSRLSK